MFLPEWLLVKMSRAPGEPDYSGGTTRATIENCLSFPVKTVPGFLALIKDKEVLDFGCGFGMHSVAMARAGAKKVVGIDLPRPYLMDRWPGVLADSPGNVTLTTAVADNEKFDIVFSCSSFEHFADPAHILALMASYAKPGGLIVITFAEPWLSPFGSHSGHFTKLPWVNCLFREKTVMKVRSRYRSDGAKRYEDVEGGLNRMTVRKFDKIIRSSGLKVRSYSAHSVRSLPLVSNLPVVREFLTAAVSCILEKPV